MPGWHVALPLICICAALLAQPCAAAPFEWEFTRSLNTAHELHTADSDGELVLVAPVAASLPLLADGKVLVAGDDDAIGRHLASAPDDLTFTDVSAASGISENNCSWGAA